MPQHDHDRRGFLRASLAAGLAAGLTPGLLTAAAAGHSRGRAAGRRRIVDPVLPWENPRPGVYVSDTNTSWGGNVLVAPGDGPADEAGVLVVDSKYPAFAPAIRHDALAAGAETVHYVNTHHHGDHSAGNITFVGKGRAHAHRNCIPRIASQHESYLNQVASSAQTAQRLGRERVTELARELADTLDSPPPEAWIPENEVGDNATVPVEGLEVRLHHAGPGHTDNDLYIHLPQRNTVHAGDLVFNGLHPFIDRPGGASARGWIESLDAIESLCDAGTTVGPGHGPIGGVRIVRDQRAYLEQLIDAVRRAIRQGTPRDELVQQRFDFMQGLGFEQIAPRAIGAVYDEITEDDV